jgi:aspartate/methionine/tyrosine aminotransferase
MDTKTFDLSLSTLTTRQIENPSPIRQIMKLAERQTIIDLGLNPDDVISFAGGWVNHEAPAPFRQAYLDIINDPVLFHQSGGYTATLGTEDCRSAIADFEKDAFGIKNLTASNIAIGLGSTQVTFDLFRTILDPGDTILLLDPTYANYEGQLAFAVPGVRAVKLSVLDPVTWNYLPRTDPDRVIAELHRIWREFKPKAVLFGSPDNPTSQIFPQAMVDAIMDRAVRDRAYVLVDFAYKCQCFDTPPPYYSWSPEDYPNIINIHSNSKWARGLGRRLGWVEAAVPVIEGLERVHQCGILCPDTLHQMTMARYIRKAIADGSLRTYIDQTREAYRVAGRATVDAVDRHLRLPRLEPEGGLYVVVDVRRNSDAFVREALKETGVLLVPGAGFGSTLSNGVRISFGPHVSSLAKIEEGIERLGRFMRKVAF